VSDANHRSPVELAHAEAQKIARRLSQHPDMMGETMWGQFIIELSNGKKSLEENCESFLKVLTYPKARMTPSAALAADELLKLFNT